MWHITCTIQLCGLSFSFHALTLCLGTNGLVWRFSFFFKRSEQYDNFTMKWVFSFPFFFSSHELFLVIFSCNTTLVYSADANWTSVGNCTLWEYLARWIKYFVNSFTCPNQDYRAGQKYGLLQRKSGQFLRKMSIFSFFFFLSSKQYFQTPIFYSGSCCTVTCPELLLFQS